MNKKKSALARVRDIFVTAGFLAAATMLCGLLRRFNSSADYISMIFVLGVFLTARFTTGYWYGIAASVVSVLLVNYVFSFPYFQFNFSLTGYPLTIISMLVVSITTSAMVTQAKMSQQIRREAEREKTRSNLLRAVSHDLRTPLTSILGATSAVIENDAYLTSEQRVGLLRGAQEDAQWLIRMVENLLAVTRIDGSRRAKITTKLEAAEEVVANTVAKFKKRFPDVGIIARAPDELLMVPMDAVLIQQVLDNLVENAVLHGRTTTCVTLSVRRQDGLAVFEVRDDGAGIKPEKLPHIFEGYSSAEDSEGDSKRNMGIGLSVCNTIVKAHGGVMQAGNLPDGGAIFSFTLNLAEGTAR